MPSSSALRPGLLLLFAVASCDLPGPPHNTLHWQNGALRVVDQGHLAGQNPCSSGRAGLDRWCVFFKTKQNNTRGQDVWVMNISRLGRGDDLQCHSPGPGCVLVAAGDHVVHAGFVADTLLVDAIPPNGSPMPNPVIAWRPDWNEPATLTNQPASGCWVDDSTEAVACVEADADRDASSKSTGTFRAGRLTRAQRSLAVVPEGREMVQVLPASDRLLVRLSPGIAAVQLTSGTVEVLQTQTNEAFSVTPDEKWLLSFVGQKTDTTGTRTLMAAPFPNGTPRHVLLADVSRHRFLDGPRATGADVLAIVANPDGTDHLMLVGPDADGGAITSDLGPWTGTTTAKLDATSADGYATVADTQGGFVLPLLTAGPLCPLGDKTVSTAQVLTVPSLDRLVWVAAGAGTAGQGFESTLSTCATGVPFSASAVGLQLAGPRTLLFLDSAKDLMRLDLVTAGAAPAAMRDPDEVVYRWSYSGADDVLLLEMTSSFDTETRLYGLRHPFPSP